ncbi:MAG TPA: TfoX/Sxy family protein [Xanthobacteraceae bacterium]|nr:TfoX/Sxy family protein [Xanthobacteraceae bacterium]
MDPDYIRELFENFRPVDVRRMFGGAGIFCDGLMFGLIFDGAIYLKIDDATMPDFEREGSKPFVYTRAKSPGRVGKASVNYWRLPERLYDDPEDLAVWAARAFAIAQRKKVGKSTAKKAPAAKPARKKRKAVRKSV